MGTAERDCARAAVMLVTDKQGIDREITPRNDDSDGMIFANECNCNVCLYIDVEKRGEKRQKNSYAGHAEEIYEGHFLTGCFINDGHNRFRSNRNSESANFIKSGRFTVKK